MRQRPASPVAEVSWHSARQAGARRVWCWYQLVRERGAGTWPSLPALSSVPPSFAPRSARAPRSATPPASPGPASSAVPKSSNSAFLRSGFARWYALREEGRLTPGMDARRKPSPLISSHVRKKKTPAIGLMVDKRNCNTHGSRHGRSMVCGRRGDRGRQTAGGGQLAVRQDCLQARHAGSVSTRTLLGPTW